MVMDSLGLLESDSTMPHRGIALSLLFWNVSNMDIVLMVGAVTTIATATIGQMMTEMVTAMAIFNDGNGQRKS